MEGKRENIAESEFESSFYFYHWRGNNNEYLQLRRETRNLIYIYKKKKRKRCIKTNVLKQNKEKKKKSLCSILLGHNGILLGHILIQKLIFFLFLVHLI